jgi:hypothetical protein
MHLLVAGKAHHRSNFLRLFCQNELFWPRGLAGGGVGRCRPPPPKGGGGKRPGTSCLRVLGAYRGGDCGWIECLVPGGAGAVARWYQGGPAGAVDLHNLAPRLSYREVMQDTSRRASSGHAVHVCAAARPRASCLCHWGGRLLRCGAGVRWAKLDLAWEFGSPGHVGAALQKPPAFFQFLRRRGGGGWGRGEGHEKANGF